MIKGIYQTAASMVPRVKQQEVMAHNLANAETAGFKKDSVFVRMVKAEQSQASKLAPSWEVRMLDKVYTDYSQGPLDKTGRELDLALEGDGFFTVETPQGEAYTRNGSFTLQSDGTLVTSDSLPVLADSGRVVVTGKEITFDFDGRIVVDGQAVGKLKVVSFADPTALQKLSSSLFQAPPNLSPEIVESPVVRQGYLERSNVDMLREMVEMIASYRSFETGQKMIQIQDESLGRAVNDIARV